MCLWSNETVCYRCAACSLDCAKQRTIAHVRKVQHMPAETQSEEEHSPSKNNIEGTACAAEVVREEVQTALQQLTPV